jgi:uncharacterized protein (PEP-CTERM system associated)
VYASRNIGDATNMLRYGPDRDTPIESPTGIGSADVFVSDGIGVGWHFKMARTGFSIGVDGTKEVHDQDAGLDRKVRSANARFERLITPFLGFNIGARYERETFDSTSFENKRKDATAGLNWRIGRRIDLGFQYQRYDQDSTDETATFTENRLGLNVVCHLTTQAQ